MDIFVPLFKADAVRREVHGLMAEERKDRTGEIFDYASSKPYVKAWTEEQSRASRGKSFGNVRGQHSKVAAGKLVGITFDDSNKCVSIVAKIVDDSEWRKVEEGVYTGFSIGGSYVKKWDDGGATRYTAKPSEVSIVDTPAMYGATFSLVKADGTFEHRGFAGAPSTPSSELDRLRVQVRGQLSELMTKINALAANRAAAATKFNINGREVEKSDEINREFLNKALANGTRIDVAQAEVSTSPRFQAVESVGSGQRVRSGQPFDVNGVEKSDVADAELQKALSNGKRVDCQ